MNNLDNFSNLDDKMGKKEILICKIIRGIRKITSFFDLSSSELKLFRSKAKNKFRTIKFPMTKVGRKMAKQEEAPCCIPFHKSERRLNYKKRERITFRYKWKEWINLCKIYYRKPLPLLSYNPRVVQSIHRKGYEISSWTNGRSH